MSTELKFNLTRAAKSNSGDRYEAEVGEPKPMVIYIPQKISRREGIPASGLVVTIDLVD